MRRRRDLAAGPASRTRHTGPNGSLAAAAQLDGRIYLITDTSPDRDYSHHPMVVQALATLPAFDGFHPVLGAWIVGEACAGLGIREDRGRITRDLSRFKPHYIEG